MIDGAICFPSSPVATREQPEPSRALCDVMLRERAGFYVKVSRDSHLFCRLNICKFHLQCVGQSFRHQRAQFYALPALKIFWWGNKARSFCWITFQLCTGGDFTKLTCRLSNFHPSHLKQGIMFYYNENFSPCDQPQRKNNQHFHAPSIHPIHRGCQRCPIALLLKPTVELKLQAKWNKQNRREGFLISLNTMERL